MQKLQLVERDIDGEISGHQESYYAATTARWHMK
jgi:hypothetical protein